MLSIVENSDFVVHGVYSLGLFGYEVELSKDGDGARLRSFDSDGVPTVTDWLPIEQVWPDEYDEPGDGEQDLSAVNVIDPEGHNVPLNEVMRANIFSF